MGVFLPVPDVLIDLGRDVSRILKSVEAAERRVDAFNTQLGALRPGFERLRLLGSSVDNLQRTLLTVQDEVRSIQNKLDRKA